jgi:hypothetical protein
MSNTENRIITLAELKNIYYKMDYYNRDSGYMAIDLSNELNFYDSEPSFGGVFITKENILNYISDY